MALGGGIRHSFLRTGSDDPGQVSRVLGVLYLSGGALVLLSLVFPHPEGANQAGLITIAGTALVVGGASIVWAIHARVWTLHTVLAVGTGLISLCIFFAGVATPIYGAMFLWVVLVAASFFAGPAIAAHFLWVIAASGLTLLLVEQPSEFSALTRWILGGLVLGVAAAVMSELVAARRSIEEQLRGEIEERGRLESELEHLAHHDPLTGVANRRLFELELTREFARADRHERQLSLVALDLDGFKEYNDEHGHIVGDHLLKAVAGAWSHALRSEDVIARIGGDEFMVLLPECPPAEAEQVVQRLRSAAPTGCSTGVATWDGRESVESLLTRADQAMYEAKKSRRSESRRPQPSSSGMHAGRSPAVTA